MNSPYGHDNRGPFKLYQAEDGRWGLEDADGVRLPAVFQRSADGEVFSRVPWESVTFNENEGFDLLAWYDPCEVWFNFTFNNPDYPDRWASLLWAKCDDTFADFKEAFLVQLPESDRWIIEEISAWIETEKEVELQCGRDYDKETELLQEYWREVVNRRPEVLNSGSINQLFKPILDCPTIAQNEKALLWTSKVYFDSCLREYL